MVVTQVFRAVLFIVEIIKILLLDGVDCIITSYFLILWADQNTALIDIWHQLALKNMVFLRHFPSWAFLRVAVILRVTFLALVVYASCAFIWPVSCILTRLGSSSTSCPLFRLNLSLIAPASVGCTLEVSMTFRFGISVLRAFLFGRLNLTTLSKLTILEEAGVAIILLFAKAAKCLGTKRPVTCSLLRGQRLWLYSVVGLEERI